MHFCNVPFCRSRSKDHKISFHEFPADLELRSRWLKAIFSDGFIPTLKTGYGYVCGNHFKETDFIQGRKFRCLKSGTVPSKFLKENPNDNQNLSAKKLKPRSYKNKKESSLLIFPTWVKWSITPVNQGGSMDTKKSLAVFKVLKTTEKRCNKCGFGTFSLRVLYSHRYKCRGQLLGSLTCSYCKRKFNYLSLFQKHRKTCVKFYQKKIDLEKISCRSKLKEKDSKKENTDKEKCVTKASVVACPICTKLFTSKTEYNLHVRKGSCSSKQLIKKQASARKSFTKAQNVLKETKDIRKWQSDSDDSYINDSHSINLPIKGKKEPNSQFNNNPGFSCVWCRNVYPTKNILLKHLERNSQCAAAHHRQKSRPKGSARKTLQKPVSVVARKSFPRSSHSKDTPSWPNSLSALAGGSARKSLPNSSQIKIKSKVSPLNSLLKFLNQCPVCYEKFPDSFNFFRHQKKFNHWGKATKSTNTVCKCPFCEKQFFHVRARNSHLRNHVDKSEREIKLFLKKTTCDICSRIFVSETAKYQHMKIEHPESMIGVSSREVGRKKQENFNNKHSSLLPLVIKQKLRLYPNTCPICSKDFPSTHFRNKHFQEKHLDSELQCKFCTEKYNSVDGLEYHMQEAHYDSFKFECLACRINLATAPHVVLHVTKVHSDQDPKSIIRCRANESVLSSEEGEEFVPNRGANRTRQEYHGANEDFYCDICNLSFQRKHGLQSHRQSKSHKEMLVKNLDAMHQSLADLPSPPPTARKNPKQQPEILTCTECFEDFTTVKDFVPHRLGHFSQGKYMRINELNLYTCEICGEVSDSHSKVQMHLFWHLQVESTSNEKSSVKDKGRNPIVPDRLSGQQVAKKSFSKSPDSQQEVVIGGVKKPLFTCEACNIGFTTQTHYSLHVRKFCKVKNASPKETSREEYNEDPLGVKSSINIKSAGKRLVKNKVYVEKRNTKHCTVCNSLFDLSIREVHRKFCKSCAQDTSEIKQGVVAHIKSDMERQNAIGACITCCRLFGNSKVFSEHMLSRHMSNESSSSGEGETSGDFKNTVLCTTCNCLFLSSLVQDNHEAFCTNSSYHNFDADSSKDILKPFTELEDAIAICISCSLVFSNIRNLKKHVLQHKNKVSQESLRQKEEETASLNGPKIEDDEFMELSADFTSKNSVTNVSVTSASQDSSENECSAPETLEFTTSKKPVDFSSSLSNDSVTGSSKTDQLSIPSKLITHDGRKGRILEDPINVLRENFSQLFHILINDAELMQQLGYGEQPVDDVLTNVLQQMGQIPVLKDGDMSDIECLRKNIQILLDFCLKDQIMELIGSGKTSTDDIVVEALKMFSSEENNSL